MNTNITPPNGRGKGNFTRSSLACLLCRSRHLKCDGSRPHCKRCVEDAKQCQYTRSRRGGLDRAALTERRRRLEAANRKNQEVPSAADDDTSDPPIQPSLDSLGRQRCGSESTPPQAFGDVGVDHLSNGHGLRDETSSSRSPAAAPQVDIGSGIEDDPLITSYYKNFHKFHPLVLPQKHLTRIHKDPCIRLNLKPLIAILRFIGHIYYSSSCEWSTPLRAHVETCFAEASPTDPSMVQCRLLYSIVLFWNNHKVDSKREMDAAVRLALDLQMFRQDFAAKFGAQDAVLTECWRRTWWMLYMIDAFYAGTLGTMNLVTLDVHATVDLPCEELEYEQGVSEPTLPTPFSFERKQYHQCRIGLIEMAENKCS